MLTHLDAAIAFLVVILFASLLGTVITQIAVYALNLRGANLKWGLVKLLSELRSDPAAGPGDKSWVKRLEQWFARPGKNPARTPVERIVERVLTHPLISKSNRLASVIRIEELSTLLVKLAESNREFTDPITDKATKTWLKGFTKEHPREHPDDLVEKLKGLESYLSPGKREILATARGIVEKQVKSTRKNLEELGEWFDKMTDRLSERFTLHSRLVSLGAAVIVAGGMQLDSIGLLQSIYADDDLRASLVASTDTVLEEGKKILGRKEVIGRAVAELRKKNPDLPKGPAVFRSSAEFTSWLQKQKLDQSRRDELIAAYDEIAGRLLKRRISALSDDYRALNEKMDQLGLKILSADYNWNLGQWPATKYLGILISIVLLSLGAPFWFNILQRVVSLRGRLMQKEEQERTKRQKKALALE